MDLLVNCLVENHFSVDLDVFDDVTINQYSLPRVYRWAYIQELFILLSVYSNVLRVDLDVFDDVTLNFLVYIDKHVFMINVLVNCI